MPAVAERLSDEGFVTLRFDYRGLGEREGPPFRLIPLEQIEDIRNGLSYLGVRSEVDPERLAIWALVSEVLTPPPLPPSRVGAASFHKRTRNGP